MGIYKRNVSHLYGFGKELDLPEMPERLKEKLIFPSDLETPEEIKIFAFLDTVEKAHLHPDIIQACHLSKTQARKAIKSLMKKKHIRCCGLALYKLNNKRSDG